MKCKYCGGTGYDDTQRSTVMTEFPPCPWCGGSGYVKDKKQTNREWLESLPSLEMANWIVKTIIDNAHAAKYCNPDYWKNWLEEEHKD